jgi:hypothetical protein
MSIDRWIDSNPVLSICQSPHQEVVALGTLLVVAMSHKEVPRHGIIAETVERKNLCANILRLIVSRFDKKDGVACSCKICSECAFLELALVPLTNVCSMHPYHHQVQIQSRYSRTC